MLVQHTPILDNTLPTRISGNEKRERAAPHFSLNFLERRSSHYTYSLWKCWNW